LTINNTAEVDLQSKIAQKAVGGIKSNKHNKAPAAVWTSTKQSMSYVTVTGIESDTSWQERDFPKESTKELTSNAWDWHQDYYPDGTKETRKIALNLKIDSIQDDEGEERIIIRIRVRNSNPDNIPVFENLQSIFDYKQFHSTKRNQHRMVSGALGDFLKRGLGMGYALWTANYNRALSLTEKQWPEPIIIRHNGYEDKVYIHVKWDEQDYWPVFGDRIEYDCPDFTEVEVALPIESTRNDYWKENVEWVLGQIEGYFIRNKIGKTNTESTFKVEGFDY
jgi:hypothetical protein